MIVAKTAHSNYFKIIINSLIRARILSLKFTKLFGILAEIFNTYAPQ